MLYNITYHFHLAPMLAPLLPSFPHEPPLRVAHEAQLIGYLIRFPCQISRCLGLFKSKAYHEKQRHLLITYRHFIVYENNLIIYIVIVYASCVHKYICYIQL